MIKNKSKQLIYSANKPGRGTRFKIYSNGEIIIQGMGSQYGINIPTRLREWIEPQTSKEEWDCELSIKLKVSKGSEHCIHNNLVSKLIVKQKKWCLLPKNTRCFGTNLYELLSERANVTCTFILPTILWSEKFKQAIQLIKSFVAHKKPELTAIIAGGKATGSYEVLQNTLGQLFIKLNISMSESGRIQFPAELADIFEAWGTTKDQFLCFCGNEQPIIGSTTLINSTLRPERVRKVLHIPYNGSRKRVELLLFNSNIKLTERMRKDWDIRKQLVTAGCNITSLISNSKSGNTHWDKLLEQKYQQFLTKTFSKNKTDCALSEVRITTSTKQQIISLNNSYTFDFMIFQPSKFNDNQPLTLLCEFKTSLGKTKTNIITKAIANLRHIHHQISESMTVPILFLCEDLTVGKEVVTSTYSNYCGILLIGPEELAKYEENPSLFLKRIKQYQQTQKVLRNQNSQIIHPQTGEIVSRSELEKEAHTLLTFKGNLTRLTSEWKRNYCSLMGIRLHDFHILFEYFQKELLDYTASITPFNKTSNRIIQIRKSVLKKMHLFLCEHKSVAIIEVLNKIETNELCQKILKQKDVILTTFPSDVVVLGQKISNNMGVAFEQEIQTFLEKTSIFVVANLWCYYRGRKFEVDLIGFKENKIMIVSCKDLSTYNDWDMLVVIIKTAANKLKYRKELMNAHFAKLFINPNPKYKTRLQQKFNHTTWCKNVEIEIWS